MRTLIFSTKTGQGHNTASYAVRDCLENSGYEAVVKDILKSKNDSVSTLVSKAYNNMVLHVPTMFGTLYHAGEIISSNKHHSPVYYLNSMYSEKLLCEIEDINPHVIVCTHIFSAQAVTRLREKRGFKTPAIGIMTDYTCSPFWEETRLDAYVIPAEQLTDEFVGRGLKKEMLYPYGIPVNPCFKEEHSKEEARMEFKITASKLFLIMGGSMGYGNMLELAMKLLSKIPDSKVAAVCGNNETLYNNLSGIKNVIPFKYINNVNVLMDAADVIITKPGGLSSTEAMVKRKPVVLTCPIPGGEVCNAEFLSSINAAVYAKNTEDAAESAARLMSDKDMSEKITEAQKKYININAEIDIAKLIVELAAMGS